MQLGSAGLHCAVVGRHFPFEQNSFAPHFTPAHALGCETAL
jgi:hypothetical protein